MTGGGGADVRSAFVAAYLIIEGLLRPDAGERRFYDW